MAKAFKCDVCGEFYEFYPMVVDRQHNRYAFNGIRSSDLELEQDIDLCPECMLAVVNFLNNRKEICNDSYEDYDGF